VSEEVAGLLRKGAVVAIPLDWEENVYFSTYFIVPKKEGGLRSILNLKYFNINVRKRKFKMETLKSIISAVSPHQLLVSMDLKETRTHNFTWQ